MGIAAGIELMDRFCIDDPLLAQLGVALRAQGGQPRPFCRLMLAGLVSTLVAHIGQHHSNRGAASLAARSGGLSPAHLKLVLDHIDAHIAEEIGLDELAALAGKSPCHFLRCFKQIDRHLAASLRDPAPGGPCLRAADRRAAPGGDRSGLRLRRSVAFRPRLPPRAQPDPHGLPPPGGALTACRLQRIRDGSPKEEQGCQTRLGARPTWRKTTCAKSSKRDGRVLNLARATPPN